MGDADLMPIVIEWINAVSTVAIAVAAVVSAILAYHLFRENRLLRKAGTEPKVIAYLKTDSRMNGAVNFVLANIGEGPARNIRFSFDVEESVFDQHGIVLRNEAERRAINILPQGERVESYFGTIPKLLGKPKMEPFAVSIKYENLNGGSDGEEHVLDVYQFRGFATYGRPTDVEIASSVRKIENTLNRCCSAILSRDP